MKIVIAIVIVFLTGKSIHRRMSQQRRQSAGLWNHWNELQCFACYRLPNVQSSNVFQRGLQLCPETSNVVALATRCHDANPRVPTHSRGGVVQLPYER